MATETERVFVSPEQDSSAIIEACKKKGWKYVGNQMVIAMIFEREVPDPPPSATSVGTSARQSPPAPPLDTEALIPPEDDPDPAREYDPTAGLR